MTCDRCPATFRGDFVVSDLIAPPVRLDLARAYVRTIGWSCTDAGDFCPACTGPAPAPAELPHLGALMAAHSPVAGQCAWDGTFCRDCTRETGSAVRWPCAPVLAEADVVPFGGGWSITARPVAVVA
ncbi:hypothetical protein [Kitasatospora sp. McL0602]|uniref:hypothetical protein n=1 Tax=Kitasatospora sp. McL0602 TaxID=3439530 RepID=UPI003F8B5302